MEQKSAAAGSICPIAVSVVMPAFEEGHAIADIIARVRDVLTPLVESHEIIVVNDGSGDDTAQKAREAGALVYSHPYNIGNGAAIKTGIRKARGAVIITMDADGQHPPENIPDLLAKLPRYDMAVGARTSQSDTQFHRDFANAVYNGLASYVTGARIADLTSGFRAVKAEIARQFVGLLPNTFSYPSTITMALFRSGYSVAYVPISSPRRQGKSKIKLFRDGIRFFFIILKIATLFSPMKIFLPISVIMFLSGLIYGLVKIFVFHIPYGPTSAMLMTVAVLVFLIGLVSEQVSQIRFDHAGERAHENCQAPEEPGL